MSEHRSRQKRPAARARGKGVTGDSPSASEQASHSEATTARAKPARAKRRAARRQRALLPSHTTTRPAREDRSPDDGAIVITGICGRMGRLLTRRLHREGPVIGIDRRAFDGKPRDVVHVQTDLRRRKSRDIFRSGDIRAVVHLGTMHNLRESDRTHHSWNVVGFQKLLESVSQYQVPKLIVLSTASLYGPSPDNPHFLTEDAPLLGAQEFSQIRDLVEVDILAQSFFWKEPDIDTVILRPCHILGKTRNAPSNYVRMDKPITVMGFDPMMQVIHERDVIEAIHLSLRPGARGVYNLRGPGEMPLSRMLRLAGKHPTAIPGPLINTLMKRLWNYRAVSFPTPELDHLRYICMVDDRRARDELGFSPRFTIEQTVRAPYSER